MAVCHHLTAEREDVLEAIVSKPVSVFSQQGELADGVKSRQDRGDHSTCRLLLQKKKHEEQTLWDSNGVI